MMDYFEISEEIREAIGKGKRGKPVVALESNLITHGLPFPENIDTAFQMEKNIREQGAIPATIAIIDGKIKVGLSHDEIEKLAHSKSTIKASKRDLSSLIAKGMNAGTTVALTMWIAHHCQIIFFATGGIGGVHNNYQGEYPMDISTDLTELARTPVAVICSGAKAILDIPHTMEYLETVGVPVLGYQTEDLPAFYSQSSHLKVDYPLKDSWEAAQVVWAHLRLKLGTGLLITNPVPTEFALSKKKVDHWIEQAMKLAHQDNIKGKKLTPYLLNKIKDLSDGRSLKANIELLKHNACIAAQIALAYQEIFLSTANK
ncbi:MAG: pseudouridine-5'-phosphate glycosidase [Atribacterota bacterium]|jgi:pseudouridine-5'-phosphate glycosidase|nr:pseudouridine-5'-phosphate glycosidase [Atribacterota bacterium]MDD4896456.1 pseudouridine-5'-phosphate glycosidase [Atribacterota bacterium]MDD5636870.1 pseudouridine-5'-phosphate glycosidase [Atribacterota bacterium]